MPGCRIRVQIQSRGGLMMRSGAGRYLRSAFILRKYARRTAFDCCCTECELMNSSPRELEARLQQMAALRLYETGGETVRNPGDERMVAYIYNLGSADRWIHRSSETYGHIRASNLLLERHGPCGAALGLRMRAERSPHVATWVKSGEGEQMRNHSSQPVSAARDACPNARA